MRRRAYGVATRWAKRGLSAVAAAVLAATTGCGSNPPPAPDPVPRGWTQEGLASWYGPGFDGKPTASGEIYDMEGMTAAHPTLPLGTWVRVRNLENDRRVRVRITDRGPFVDDRIIDLSRAAARELLIVGPGTARVRVTVLEPGPEAACRYVQVGSFRRGEHVEAARDRLRRHGHGVRTEPGPDGTVRVLAGPFPDLAAARRVQERHGGLLRRCRSVAG